MPDEVLDPFAKSRAQVDELPPRLRKTAEQMLWRLAAFRGSSPKADEVRIGPCPRYPPLFLLPPAPVGKQVAIQNAKGAFRFWKRISRAILR
jgi:hypothetical protein